jgi:hypothetical protein
MRPPIYRSGAQSLLSYVLQLAWRPYSQHCYQKCWHVCHVPDDNISVFCPVVAAGALLLCASLVLVHYARGLIQDKIPRDWYHPAKILDNLSDSTGRASSSTSRKP